MNNLKKLAKLSLLTTLLYSTASIATDTKDFSKWQVRLRAISIDPDEDSTLSIPGNAEVASKITPELDISYGAGVD
jgi:outer membrane protein W